MSDITRVVKALCSSPHRDALGNVIPLAIEPATMRGAFASILDGGASDLEIGALMTASATLEAQRAADWFAEIILGLSDAMRERLSPLVADDSSAPVVVMPNYGDEETFPTMPLVALLLRRLGVHVLVHGAIETHGGLLNSSIFREFDILPATTRGQASRQLMETGLVLLPASLFSPGLAAMLSLRNRLGIRTPAHAIANMLMPVLATSRRSLHVLCIAPWLKSRLVDEDVILATPALLVASDEISGERRLERGLHIAFRDGERSPGWEVLLDTGDLSSRTRGSGGAVFDHLPDGNDPHAWAEWTRHRLEGKAVLPRLVASQLACCLYGCGYARDFQQAKAIAAVEISTLAAA